MSDWASFETSPRAHTAARGCPPHARGHTRRSATTTAAPSDARRPTSRWRLLEFAAEPLFVTYLTELREALAKEPAAPSSRTLRGTTDCGEKREKLATKRARYLEMYADGVMTSEAMRAALAKVDAQMLTLSAEEQAPLADRKVRAAVLREIAVLELASRVARPKQRRVIVREFATQVLLAADEAPVPRWRAVEDLSSLVEEAP